MNISFFFNKSACGTLNLDLHINIVLNSADYKKFFDSTAETIFLPHR